MIRRLLLGIIILPVLLLNSEVRAQGTTGFEILRLDIYPRGSALAGATVADANSIECIYYNPAGLWSLEKRTAAFGYVNYLLDIGSGYVAYVEPRQLWGTWGIFANYTSYGKFDGRSVTGVDEGEFSASDIIFGLSYANNIKNRVSIGVNGKFVHSTIDNYIGTALAFDLGSQVELIPDRLRLGAG
ncbi:MAG: PorV/PorQ family protein, partial [bacterium]